MVTFGASNRTWLQGDFNGDGVVDTLDFNALAANFGRSVRAGSSIVPEPAGLTLLICGGLLLGRRRSIQK